MSHKCDIKGDMVKRIIKSLKQLKNKTTFKGSKQYWEDEHSSGGNSGPGSYDEFAMMKAKVINKFVKDHKIKSVIEFGCDDGNQLSLMNYPRYLGLDVSPTAIKLCQKRFKDDLNKSFMQYDTLHYHDNAGFLKADLVLALDVLGHIFG